MNIGTHIRRSAAREDGFTMIVAIMVLFVSSLLVAAVFIGADGDVKLTRTNTNQKEAYYAAMAGISAYRYELNANANYWERCPSIKETTIPGATEESYKVRTLPAEGHAYDESECQAKGRSAVLQTSATATGAFEIESTGIYGKGTSDEAKRSLVATFTHPGYLNYAYLSNFELADPQTTEETTGVSEEECEYYYNERKEKNLTTKCESIPWITGDKIEGPFHTNDASDITGTVLFGRSGHSDAVEMDQSYYGGTPTLEGGSKITKGATLLPPEAPANELLNEAGLKYEGRTIIVLEGSEMKVTNAIKNEKEAPHAFPSNGVIAVENSSAGCPVPYQALETNYATEKEQDASCGDVYIRGAYTQSLTVIAQEDVIVTGNLTTEGGTSGGEPKGSAALGLIAIGHARLYHPIKECKAPVPHKATVEPEAEVTEGSEILKKVSPTSGISVGSEIAGPKIPSGSTVLKTNNLASKGEITISNKIEETEVEAEVKGGSEVLKVSPTSGITVGAEISGTKIKSGSTVLKTNNLASKGEITISNKVEETEVEVEVTEGSTTLKKVPSTSGITVGTEISGTKIKSGSKVTSTTNLASKGEITISEKVEGTKGKSSSEKIIPKGQTGKEPIKIKGQTSKEKVAITTTTTVEEVVKCGNTVEKCPKSGTATATENPAKEFGKALDNPIIDAAILSTKHSWGVDNFSCGGTRTEELGKITVWGSIAENWRGRVDCSCAVYNYTKSYKYDERLKTIQPPDFLTPSSSEINLSRVTAPPNGFPEG